MYAALKKVSFLPNGYHWENNFQDDREYSRGYMYIRHSLPIFCS